MNGVVEQRVILLGIYQQEARLRELHRWLTIGGSSWVVGGSAVFMPYGIIIMVMKWAAVLFAPYMMWRLWQLRRFGWLAAFAVLVVLPLVLSLMPSELSVGSYLLGMVPLLTFYLFTWALRHAVATWQEKIRWRREDARTRAVASVGA